MFKYSRFIRLSFLILLTALAGCSPKVDPFASIPVAVLDEQATAITSRPGCRTLKNTHRFYASEARDLTGGRMFLMANLDGRTCLHIEEGTSLHIVGKARLEDRWYFKVETKLDPGFFWWVPQFWH
jgi:hypothetical protein